MNKIIIQSYLTLLRLNDRLDHHSVDTLILSHFFHGEIHFLSSSIPISCQDSRIFIFNSVHFIFLAGFGKPFVLVTPKLSNPWGYNLDFVVVIHLPILISTYC